MYQQQAVIVSDPGILDGKPVFRGTRAPFQNLVDYLQTSTLQEFIESFDIDRETALQALVQMDRTDLLR